MVRFSVTITFTSYNFLFDCIVNAADTLDLGGIGNGFKKMLDSSSLEKTIGQLTDILKKTPLGSLLAPFLIILGPLVGVLVALFTGVLSALLGIVGGLNG